MYSGTVKLATVGIILSTLNIFCVAPVLLYLNSLKNLPWPYFFAMSIVLVTASAILLLTSCALRSAAQDMNMNNETYMTKITDLKKRVDELEKKVKL